MSAWPRAVASIGMIGLYLHDLRHTGNQFAQSGAALRDLMARMGYDSERAAMIYPSTRPAALISSPRAPSTPMSKASSARTAKTRPKVLTPAGHRPKFSPLRATGTLMARKINYGSQETRERTTKTALTWELTTQSG
jgi:hypothetical protein